MTNHRPVPDDVLRQTADAGQGVVPLLGLHYVEDLVVETFDGLRVSMQQPGWSEWYFTTRDLAVEMLALRESVRGILARQPGAWAYARGLLPENHEA